MDPLSKAQTDTANNVPSQYRGLRPWKPGQSGNPSGRPKQKPITDLCEEIINNPETRERIKQQLINTLTTKGMAGVLLLRELAERTEGKITQGIELSGSVNAMTDVEIMQKMASLLDVKIDDEPAKLPEPAEITTK